MAGSISVQCPNCKAVLKLKSSKALGKRAPCPKCKKPFLLKATKRRAPKPEAVAGPPGGLGEPGGDDTAPVTSSVRRRRATSKKPTRKKAASTAWKKPALIAGGSLLAIGLVIGAIALFSGGTPAPKTETAAETALDVADKKEAEVPAANAGEKLDLSYLPTDAELFLSVRVSDLWNSSLVKSLVDNPAAQDSIGKMRDAIGLEPGDIKSVIVGISDLSKLAKAGPPSLMNPPDMSEVGFVCVVRVGKTIDRQKLLASLEEDAGKLEEVSESEKTYYRGETPDGTGGIYFADEKTIVFGPEKSVQTAIATGGKTATRSDLDFVDAQQHLLLALVPSDPSLFDKGVGQVSAGAASESASQLADTAQGKLRAGSIGLKLTEGISVQLRGNCLDSDGAQAVVAELKKVVQEGRDQLAKKKEATPPDFQKFVELAGSFLATLQPSQNGSVAEVTGSLPASSTETLKELPGAIMAMMLSGAGGFEAVSQASPGASPFGPGEAPGMNGPSAAFSFGDSDQKPEPVAEVEADGLRQRLFLSYEPPPGSFAPSETKTPPLFVTVELAGEAAAQATAYGLLHIASAKDDKDKTLEQIESPFGMNDPAQQLVKIDRNMMFAGTINPPKDTIKVDLMVQHPSADATQLAQLEGSLQLMTGGEKKVVAVVHVLDHQDAPLSNPELKEAGLSVLVSHPKTGNADGAMKSLTVTVTGPSESLDELMLVGADGEQLNSGSGWSGTGDTIVHTLDSEQELPPDTTLKLTVWVNQKRVTIPFAFQNAALPKATAE